METTITSRVLEKPKAKKIRYGDVGALQSFRDGTYDYIKLWDSYSQGFKDMALNGSMELTDGCDEDDMVFLISATISIEVDPNV